MGYIEEVHKNNFKLIKKHGIKKGNTFQHKESKVIVEIESIHPLYGWVVGVPYCLKQDLSNIGEFEKVKLNEHGWIIK